ncbi:hypothetical protein UY3_18266 [Chelonia mydas]|uniref:Uncharacterized protein n=1 Tax=Chelonia mydas TaxID=8469 RepID=M7AK14_CHEMY|nr:hypothetical protein UY3_18266 [Chelonia mydas]
MDDCRDGQSLKWLSQCSTAGKAEHPVTVLSVDQHELNLITMSRPLTNSFSTINPVETIGISKLCCFDLCAVLRLQSLGCANQQAFPIPALERQ